MEEADSVRVLVTGSRKWTNWTLSWTALTALYECWEEIGCPGGEFIVVQGEAPGLDRICRHWAEAARLIDARIDHEDHRAQWELLGKAAGSIRNREMVERGADICIGFPTPESIGTYDCMERARTVGIPTFDITEFPWAS